MIPDWTSFRNRALRGYAIAILPLAAAMALMVARLDSAATEQAEHLRKEENEIELAQHLRWNAELLVSAGRGYLISEAPALLTKVQQNELEFDAGLREIEAQTLSAAGMSLLRDAERAARQFRKSQAQLLADRARGESGADVVDRFETQLLPLSAELGGSLGRLIEYKRRALDQAYLQARRDRTQLVTWTCALLATVALVGLGLAWRLAVQLAHSYRNEQDALAATRRALGERDELMAIVAHDLRNPLQTIALHAQILSREAGSEPARRRAISIESVTATMAELINTVLNLSTLKSGDCSLELPACDVNRLLDNAMEMYGNLAAAKGIQLARPQLEVNALVRADVDRLLQVLSNLLGNALKVTPPGGTITLGFKQSGDMGCFSVVDTGPGIHREHFEHVFERGWKQDIAGTKGTGLGLFIAKRIVETHGGRIWIESEPGCGASFYFTLHLADPPRARARHGAELSPRASA